ncbi:hypothetical protein ERL59_08525 [Chengkuizengella sp. YPA3-1-1]|uniref:Uncharacterized protein n=1 Tax=Chengkuizengella marina TaxID=2507566 RepID=A0A6N9Q1C4_9BACL|nr:hypothetical protein [Chengkuizengella marina]
MKHINPMRIIVTLYITILLIFDYFPVISLEITKIFTWIFIAIIIVSIIFGRKKVKDNINEVIIQIFINIYVIFLMGLLTILGGKSTLGISFDNGFFWIIFLLSFFDIFSQWKKIKKVKKH